MLLPTCTLIVEPSSPNDSLEGASQENGGKRGGSKRNQGPKRKPDCVCTACGENGHWSIDMKCPQHKRHSEWKSKSGSSAVDANTVTEMSTNHTIYSIGESSGAAPLRVPPRSSAGFPIRLKVPSRVPH
ncbi:BQ5605_C001g00583 [Microbotryum silenes-dioicae]|uniref:BQ5605_C001g00583 protein n=1 Tax=Microbotryum silenes-dioicae TaxID=796604 RepID=A0A2X0M3T1_9BASI|nr:BQ5605_C001g00583 [Microbotryum silenes-dioicae]